MITFGQSLLFFSSTKIKKVLVEERLALTGFFDCLETLLFAVLVGELAESRLDTQVALFQELEELIALLSHPVQKNEYISLKIEGMAE